MEAKSLVYLRKRVLWLVSIKLAWAMPIGTHTLLDRWFNQWKNSLPQVLSRYHFQAACMRDWCRLRMHQSKLWPASPAPPACAMLQYSPTGNDILTIFIGHRYYCIYWYYCPALTHTHTHTHTDHRVSVESRQAKNSATSLCCNIYWHWLYL